MPDFTDQELRVLGEKVGIDFGVVDFEEFKMGVSEDFEHGSRDPETNVTNDNPEMTAKIAWAHLKELPDYYSRLRKMEQGE